MKKFVRIVTTIGTFRIIAVERRPETYASIIGAVRWGGENLTFSGIGIAKCSAEDTYTFREGFKHAFNRALTISEMPRPLRSAVRRFLYRSWPEMHPNHVPVEQRRRKEKEMPPSPMPRPASVMVREPEQQMSPASVHDPIAPEDIKNGIGHVQCSTTLHCGCSCLTCSARRARPRARS